MRVPKKTIVDNIEQIIAASRTARRKTWLDNIPADVRSSLEQVREKHRANEYKVCKTAVIKAIQAALAEHGLTPPSQDTVQRWLERD